MPLQQRTSNETESKDVRILQPTTMDNTNNHQQPKPHFIPREKPTWRAIHKLEFGAKPMKRNRKEWICSLECKNKNKEALVFKDAQAAEKHIMREHPDLIYDKFVCLKDGCEKEKVSPQQILDHMGQKGEKKGHNLTSKHEKDENLRAVKKSTGERFRSVPVQKELFA